jgi:hypothetical protein
MDIRTAQEAIFDDHLERTDARQDLRDTLTEVSVRIERVESDLRPDHIIEAHAVSASIVACALGFFLGSKTDSWLTGPVIAAALLSFALAARSSTQTIGRSGEYKPNTLSH